MITPRRTRLLAAAGPHAVRDAIDACVRLPGALADRAVLVPTQAAARVLAETLTHRGLVTLPSIVTRDGLYELLRRRLPQPPVWATFVEREAMAHRAAHEAAAEVGDRLPFTIRPGLVSALLEFYDQVRRQTQDVDRFESLILESVGGEDDHDRGASRLRTQTRFLAQAFRRYEQGLRASGTVDEHALRQLLLAVPAAAPLRHLIVTVPDWIADASGLYQADFDLLAQIPGLVALDLIASDRVLRSGFHERLDAWWPALETVSCPPLAVRRPRLRVPVPIGTTTAVWHTHRDREEELVRVARRLASEGEATAPPASSHAVVFRAPLAYLYLAERTFGDWQVPWRAVDELPLAAEPAASLLDLMLDVAGRDCARGPLLALLRSPFARWHAHLRPEVVRALDEALAAARYLGGASALESFLTDWVAEDPSLDAAQTEARAEVVNAVREVMAGATSLVVSDPASVHIRRVAALRAAWHADVDAADGRTRSACDDIEALLQAEADAAARFYDPVWTLDDLAAGVRRAIERRTCAVMPARDGVWLLDDRAAIYGDVAHLTVVGMTDRDWPARARRNIFYTPDLLVPLGWPSEATRDAASLARFLDLVESPTESVELSVCAYDEDAEVAPSLQLEEVAALALSTEPCRPTEGPRRLDERLAARADDLPRLDDETAAWVSLRRQQPGASVSACRGTVGPTPARAWGVSAVERYLACPFLFFAEQVLHIDEDPTDGEVMDPRRQGEFVHRVFERFFREWQDIGGGAITRANLSEARRHFADVVDRETAAVPPAEAALERARLLGTAAAAGLGEAVFRLEAAREVPVVARLLEEWVSGDLDVPDGDSTRRVPIRGKADRLDLLADGSFRLIDYKLGWPPDRRTALQLPIYGLCAGQHLRRTRGGAWPLSEAMYVAFRGPKRVVPLFTTASERDRVLTEAVERLGRALRDIEAGHFPVRPDARQRCSSCRMAAVCRREYVDGD